MTAEIVIMNKFAVALAADSKVTIGSGGYGKTYDTVNKVFTLSKVHPMGIMIFGNAEFMAYPWETIIKSYRQQKAAHSEKTVEAWAEDFTNFVRKFGEIRPQDIADNIASILIAVFENIIERAIHDARDHDLTIPSPEFTKLLQSLLEKATQNARHRKAFLNDAESKELTETHAKMMNEIVKERFGGFGDDEILKASEALGFLLLSRNYYSPQSSGYVVAGFGDNEIFPGLIHYSTDGYVGAKVKVQHETPIRITRENSSSMSPFAQKEMVQRFMNGIDPTYSNFLIRSFAEAMYENCAEVLKKYGSEENKSETVDQAIKDAVSESMKALLRKSREFTQEKFSDPIMDMIANLPKDELPHLAESLVALTSLKRHVSHDVETVGGPIDVALISKGDGFIWIKRKHYFKPELNPQFTRNYMNGMEQDGANG